MKTTMLLFVGAMSVGAVARAQDPPPPVQPPAQPPVAVPQTTPPATTPVAETVPAAGPVPARVTLTATELRSRRDAIFLMEAVLERTIELAAGSTQSAIESMQPDVRATLFSAVKPAAYGTYLEDYGVFFQVQIPTYIPSVVTILREDLGRAARPLTDPAQPMALTGPARGAAFDPDALYVEAVRRHLTDVMLRQGRSLDLRPDEWLTVSARGTENGLGGPAMMVLRVKGSDLMDFATGRLTREEVDKRVQLSAFSSRR